MAFNDEIKVLMDASVDQPTEVQVINVEKCEVTELLCLQLEKLPLSAEHALEMVSFC